MRQQLRDLRAASRALIAACDAHGEALFFGEDENREWGLSARYQEVVREVNAALNRVRRLVGGIGRRS